MDVSKARDFIDSTWADSILPRLIEYVRIPNKSPLFDPEWEAHGHMEAAVQLMHRWAQAEAARRLAHRSAAPAWPNAGPDGRHPGRRR